MFTEGLDENAIKWIKQGSDLDLPEQPPPPPPPQIRSPLAEKLTSDRFPKSPLLFSSNTSGHALPPLKFHAGLLAPHSLVAPSCLSSDMDVEDDDDESVDSVSDDYSGANFSDEESKAQTEWYQEEEESVGYSNKGRSGLNMGFLKEGLRVEVPGNNFRRFTESEVGFKQRFPPKTYTPSTANQLLKRVHLRNVNATTPSGDECGMVRDSSDLGTPSAPPIFEIASDEKGFEVESESRECGSENWTCPLREEVGHGESVEGLADVCTSTLKASELDDRVNESIAGETKIPSVQASRLDHSSYYSTSGQYAWQTLVAHEACIRLCLQAWARGCTEAPDFLRDECLALRNAFGLNTFLLQPRGMQPLEAKTSRNGEQISHPRAKKVVGKIRVEAKKLRVIPRRKLKSTFSQRGSMYIHAGAEYVRHVSSLVKTSISSLKSSSLAVTTEESLSCIFQLNSTTEDSVVEPSSAICLRPGSGDYHVFFPESQMDTLLVEVQDTKKSVQGRTRIPISSLIDNTSDKVRWWPLHHDDQECIGKIQLSVGSTITNDEANHIKSGPVAETLAYDLLLEAAMRAQNFHSRNLRLHGPWKWLLEEFADYYEVSKSYTKLRYLSHVMDVATPTKDCLELVNELLVPIIKARSEKCLTRQEKSLLLDCETQIESLLASVFENYKSLDEGSPSGLADMFGPTPESAAPALAPAVQVYTLLHDILTLDAQTMLRNYLQMAAKKRYRKHMLETDEFVSSNSEGFLMDSISISTAYLKMKNLCTNIQKEIQADIKIHNENVLPSSIDLSNITAAIYSTELCNRLRAFLAAWPPSGPQPHVNELLVVVADFERNLESWDISPVHGGVDSKNLFDNYIMLWVEDMQLNLLDLCKAEKVPWSGVSTNHSTSPFAEEMYEKIRENLIQYEVVINRWPQYSLILEHAVANVERAIIKALEKQYNDILTPLKDTIQKRLNIQVQKLTRRQSVTIYSVPNQLGKFLNTMKRILDVLHCKVEDILKSWASYLPVMGDNKKAQFGEQMNGITVLLRTKYKTYLQATVGKLISNLQANRNTRLQRILEETKEEDGEAEVRERMHALNSQLVDSISNLHEVFTSQIFIAISRGFWDRMGQIVLKFLEGRKENRVWYNGSYYALGILDDTFASQMQRLQGNALQEKDIEPPRSVIEARSILCRDTPNAADASTYFYV
ncbi:hypothetical protein RchiOBHm_Chr2g0155201 [Rosa chinensis]|uniref:Uncharacterized protein n=1 Tax=Rosa chinensis TaxID=74649 RepID=A0A2P6S152_ROSCH|nr:uncharacterized protein LOC112186163 [Rosa chinensis]PRQ52410.1 hypothetical protein RchiOBHm_Chr2g0155201 [Rosa chinensis]